MLTSVYYYNLYKPYIVSNRESGVYAPKRGRIADRRESTESYGQVYVLNKSLKDEIIRYAHNVSQGVTGLRSSTHETTTDMENFNRNVHNQGYDTALEWLTDDLAEFTDKYNDASDFLQKQTHSDGMRTFAYEVADNLYYNRDRLSMLGLSFTEDNGLRFDRSFAAKLSLDEANIAIGENIQIFADLYRQASGMLNEPLSEHMNFKGLGYHYNYQMGTMEADGFGMIETGMLIDKAV